MLIAAAGLGARCCADQYEDCSSAKCWPWLECVAYTDADGQQTKTCEIPCAGDADCPSNQHCVDVTPGPGLVCMECVGEGGATDDPARCCGGLTALSGCVPGEPCEPGWFCAACGDGVCGEHESPWECPADCADCESLDLDDRACAGLTVQFWADEQRRRTADELNALPFDERAERINAAGWFGQVPGAAVVEFHDDGTLQRLMKVELAPESLALDGVTSSSEPEVIADAFLERWGALLFGSDPSSSLSRMTRHLPLTDRTAVVYHQSFGGVPVEGGVLGISLDSEGRVVSIGNDTLPGIDHPTEPAVTIEQVEDALAAFLEVDDVEVVRHELLLARESGSRLVYDVAAREVATGHEQGAFRVDALTAEVLLKHGPEWRWSSRGTCQETDQPYVKLLLVDKDYEDAYCKEEGDQCADENWSVGESDYSPTSGIWDSDLVVWTGGDSWTQPNSEQSQLDPWDMVLLSPVAALIEGVLWPWLHANFSYCSNVLGAPGDEFVLGARAKMGAETVGFTNYAGNIYHVDGAFDIGTFAHELAHRSSYSIPFHTLPNADVGLEEARTECLSSGCPLSSATTQTAARGRWTLAWATTASTCVGPSGRVGNAGTGTSESTNRRTASSRKPGAVPWKC